MPSAEILQALRTAAAMRDKSASELADEAERQAAPAVEQLFALAIGRCRSDVALAPTAAAPLVAWARILTRRARMLPTGEGLPLLRAAEEKVQAALRLDPRDRGALEAWGDALAVRAGRQSGEEADASRAESIEKYQAVSEIGYDSWSARISLAKVWLEQAQRSSYTEAEVLYTKAELLLENVRAQESIHPPDREYADVRLQLATIARRRANLRVAAEAQPLRSQAATLCREALDAANPDGPATLIELGWLALDQVPLVGLSEGLALCREAQGNFQQALAERPMSYFALYSLGEAMAREAPLHEGAEADRLWDLAFQRFKDALVIRPEFPPAHTAYGHALLAKALRNVVGEAEPLYQEAEAHFQFVTSSRPDLPYAWNGLGDVARARAWFGTAEQTTTQLEAAEAFYRDALRRNGDYFIAFWGWGQTFYQRAIRTTGPECDQFQQHALARFHVALRIKPDYVPALLGLCATTRLTAVTKRAAEAISLLNTAIEFSQQAAAIKPENAAACVEHALTLTDLAALSSRADAAVRLDGVFAQLQNVPGWSREPWVALTHFGHAFYARAMLQDAEARQPVLQAAVEQYEAALAHRPDWLTALIGAANAKQALGDYNEAEEKYRTALRLKPDSGPAMNGFANVLRDRSRSDRRAEAARYFELAGNYLKAACERMPGRHIPLTNWGLLVLQEGNRRGGTEGEPFRQEAKRKFQEAITVKPDYDVAFHHLANLTAGEAALLDTTDAGEAKKRWAEADRYFTQVLSIRPDHYWALVDWGEMLLTWAGRNAKQAPELLESAAGRFRLALHVNPTLALAMHGLGRTHMAQAAVTPGHRRTLMRRAEHVFQSALNHQPFFPDAMESLGHLLLERALETPSSRREPELIQTTAIFEGHSKGPNDWIALRLWGEALSQLAWLKSGDAAKQLLVSASEKIDRSLAIKPDDPRTLDLRFEVVSRLNKFQR